MNRQVAEVLAIKETYCNPKVQVMNDETEYRRCALPGVTVQATEEDKKEDDKMKALILDMRGSLRRRRTRSRC